MILELNPKTEIDPKTFKVEWGHILIAAGFWPISIEDLTGKINDTFPVHYHVEDVAQWANELIETGHLEDVGHCVQNTTEGVRVAGELHRNAGAVPQVWGKFTWNRRHVEHMHETAPMLPIQTPGYTW